MTSASLTPTHLPAGPVRLAWLASVAIHAAVLFAPLGFSLWRAAPDAAPALQVRIAAPAPAPRVSAPTVRPALPPVPVERPAPVASAMPVIAAAPAAEPTPATHRAAEPPVAEAPAPAAPSRPASVASAPAAPEPAMASTARSVEVVHVPPRFDAAYLDNPPPAYPLMARRRGEQGTVIVSVDVGTDGRPQHCALHRSSGFPALDEAALKTVRSWRFVPARRGEQTVAEKVLVPMPFRLTDSAAADAGTGPRAS